MTTRVLPLDEWPRLADTGVVLLQELREAAIHGRIVVVEADGEIVGTVLVMTCAYADGLWIHPAHHKNPAVARALLEAMGPTIRATGAQAAVVATVRADVGDWVERRGGVKLPGEQYVMPARSADV